MSDAPKPRHAVDLDLRLRVVMEEGLALGPMDRSPEAVRQTADTFVDSILGYANQHLRGGHTFHPAWLTLQKVTRIPEPAQSFRVVAAYTEDGVVAGGTVLTFEMLEPQVDVAAAIKAVVADYLRTPEGYAYAKSIRMDFNLGDLDEVPEAIWRTHGLRLLRCAGLEGDIFVEHDRNLVPQEMRQAWIAAGRPA